MVMLLVMPFFLFFLGGVVGEGSTIVTFQCQDLESPLDSRFVPLGTDDGVSWFSAADSFVSPSLFQDFNPVEDPISCYGNNSLYVITQPGRDFGGVLRAFDLKNHGKMYIDVSLDPMLYSFTWIMYHPSGVLATMMGFEYGVMDIHTGKFSSLLNVANYFSAMGLTQHSLTPDGIVRFQVSNGQYGNYSEQCGWFPGNETIVNCMMDLDSLTGLIQDVTVLDQVSNFWQSVSVIPNQKYLSVIYGYIQDLSDPFTGSESYPGTVNKYSTFDAPVGYVPPGDFDVTDGDLGQFYYVNNAYFTEKQKVYYHVDVASGKVVTSSNIDVSFELSSYCNNPQSYTSGPVSFAPGYYG
eukprot:CAMPEP_0201494778 /NCGR_PEP_ID=MMETSP0151_2-20130828/49660_1 /ASSEMBLY_ACC=CAM_ASM_000257 /TAXON_ID=200890 /ORGANISM="Paramoeba atlantica, Strain 621/1 / CCAP 1560/9" /LENGTH=351 /DNA_ID=CAMNT_0047883267 /DNA_START=112 /DNA_END=1167 /DNA_ORIENTATION=-